MAEFPDWFLKDPYRPQAGEDGETDVDVLHLGVGRVAHSWEHLEGALYRLFTELMIYAHPAGNNLGTYDATYGSITSSNSRRNAITALLDQLFMRETSAHSTFSPLLKNIQRAVGRRNDVVHGLVVRYTNQGTGKSGLFVMPPNYVPLASWLSESGPFKYRYDAQSLKEIYQVIETLRNSLHTAIDELQNGVIGPAIERK